MDFLEQRFFHHILEEGVFSFVCECGPSIRRFPHSKNGAANFFGLFVDALSHFVQVLDWRVIACFQIRS